MRGANILLVEDDNAIATVVRVAIEGEGARLRHVGSLAERDAALAGDHFDAIITDVVLPDGNGLDGLSSRLTLDAKSAPVIILSAQNTLDTAVRAESEGAFNYLPKPFDLDELTATLRAALVRATRRPEARTPATDSGDASEGEAIELPIIGRDPAMQLVYRTLARVAPTDLSVLILGESGTGKELVAQAIHSSSARRAAPFVAVNMAAIPRELIESELFGHEKGAFTGAHARSSGRFEQACGGTLFLDEIGDMPLEAQTRLLRVLQSGEYSPIGSAQLKHANVRIVAATNQDLSALVAVGRFREDLYYRLNVIPIHLPSLRDRRSDVALLARHFLAEAAELGLPALDISDEALDLLAAYDWPGNVRELSNVMQRLALLTRAHRIEPQDVRRLLLDPLNDQSDDGTRASTPASGSNQSVRAAVRAWLHGHDALRAIEEQNVHHQLVSLVEEELIEAMLDRHKGNQLRTAQALGINRNTLRLKRCKD